MFMVFSCYVVFSVRQSLLSVLGSEGELEGATLRDDLDVGAIRASAALSAEALVLLDRVGREAPVLGHEDLLGAGEFVLAAAEALNDVGKHGGLGAARDEDLVDVHTGDLTIRLTEGTSHTSLETKRKEDKPQRASNVVDVFIPIGTGTAKHLVDAEHVVGVNADAKVEGITTAHLGDVLVHANAGSLEGLRGDLLLLERDEVDAGGELIDVGLLLAEIVDTDLGVRDTTAVARFDVGLTLGVAVAKTQKLRSLRAKIY